MRKIFIIILVTFCYGENTKTDVPNASTAQSPKFLLPPVNPEYIKYQEAKRQGKISGFTSDGHPLGYIPPIYQFDLSVHPVLERSAPLPDYYDLRVEEYITSVKNQGNCGACWAFASLGPIESNWMKSGYGEYDLSENNANCGHGFEWGICDGGNSYLASAYLLRGDGPILDTEDPYILDNDDYYGESDSYIPGLTPVGYVTGVQMLPPEPDNDAIKQAIYDHGALYTILYYDDFFNDSYMILSDNTYYYSGNEIPNHAVILVGWDDNKDVYGTSNDGAWICKNSWGSNWGEDGYFYISYDDTKVNGEVAYWPERKEQSNTVIHQYDSLGMILPAGCENSTAYSIVKFDIGDEDKINSIGTWVVSGNSTVQIEIYDEFNGSTPSGLLGTISSQSCQYQGYYTFDLEPPIDLELINNTNIYVKIKYNVPGAGHPIPVEALAYDSNGDLYADPAIEQDIFWISCDGTSNSWVIVGNGTDFLWDPCIKVYGAINILLGDITQDGELTISDIITLIDIKQNQDIICDRCDINSDSEINVLDVIKLLFIVLND